jgi:MarR family transcriptional regulator, transcriptional regulator for hemolysin
MEKPEKSLGFLLHDVARLLRKRFEQKAKGLGLTRSQWQILAHLAQNDGIQQGMLADLLELEPISLVRILDRLEQSGFVERRAHPKDRRIWQLYLQSKAYPLLEQMREIGSETKSEALEGVSRMDRDRLVHVLTQMKSNLANATSRSAQGAKRLGNG